ncbi:MAG TPA: hypothetical protein VIC87_10840, partial [Vicinamibacteria bacterium]
QLQGISDKLTALEGRATVLEERSTEAKAQLAAASAKLGQIREELDRDHAVTRQVRQEQSRLTRQFGTHIADQEQQFGSLTGEVGAVKGEVADSRRDLQRVTGDLGHQSGLIARNREELESLKRLGEREYTEFRLTKSQEFVRAGPLSLRLNKVDDERQKYTLTVLADDKQIEKKDKTLLEPVQFYVPRSRSLREIVVYELNDDSVTGYVSVPKELVAFRP